ncbi:hypothetical protein BXZ70DRAFT_933981 [Cristinia sonorae]|uniref:UvrD-like helicase ATP-binding domain-containing protein n=1 Tax=Cristinia sonorae TaxID=1940300 RepID=A0A8K0UQD5_9AGAR|nr:hypothetical protein BXZ70DRAFT_933981 [Cristinia sonorae]
MRKPAKNAPYIDKNLFIPAELRNQLVLETAIVNLEAVLVGCGPTGRAAIIDELITVDGLLEFIICAVSFDAAESLVSSILAEFPTTAEAFQGSQAHLLLERFTRYFWSLNLPSSGLSDSTRAVHEACVCLQAIPGLSLKTLDPTYKGDEEAEAFGGRRTGKVSQKERKHIQRGGRAVQTDVKPFEKLNVAVPRTATDAIELAKRLLEAQMTTLRDYLELLRMPEFATTFREAYIPHDPVAENGQIVPAAKADESASEPAIIGPQVPGAFPIVQPMKAALYFDSVEGFGQWRIYISTRADGNLRETRKRDPKLFKIIIKKIKELSKGQFSNDNHKRLSGPDVEVPVFEAKMTRDSRLVYHVDVVKEFGDSDVEWQVLRIFGIYTHAQLDKRFWDAVGQHLGGRGKDYKQRCTFRNPSYHQGDYVVAPASFPPSDEQTIPDKTLRLPDLRNEDREELHSLLVLEKFVTFSQALLNSILADQDVAHVFQMSPREQEIVQNASSCYVLGRSGTGKTTTMIFKMLGIERTWEQSRELLGNDVNRPRQLFVTQSKVLAEKVEEYYAKLSQSLVAEHRSSQESSKMASDKREKGLVDHDEEEFYRGELPRRFSELEDKHFPLFLTYDQLCRLLIQDTSTGDLSSATDSNDYRLQQKGSFISYMDFLDSYWRHFPQNLTKKLDPALVFAEFMGVIKGSEQTLHSESGHLAREEYEARSQNAPTGQSDAIYTLFQKYQRMRAEKRQYDAADRTHAIVKNLLASGIPGQPVNFIYVDEVQDNLLVDAHILRSICNNPSGLFWAGDTAQTISAGSSFKFNDLKAFLYRIEESNHTQNLQNAPKSFQLVTNYRSHNGIVGCAQSVVALITRFWPHTIDVLAEERGIVDGPKPVFFNGWDKDTVRYEQFLFGATGDQIEFGAKQCILVRDDAARERLRAQVGEIGVILTLYESKGLEFDDVLLYDFFEDSTVEVSQWRVVLNILADDGREVNCPRFNEIRHSGVCRELKFLYVAITRARKNLWIADCSERGTPMRAVWDAKEQVQHCFPGDNVPKLATSSTPEEWAQTARTLFDNRRYAQAAHSFERAGLPRERNIAEAYHLRHQARSKTHASDGARKEAFLATAQAFLGSARAGGNTSDAQSYYRIAAECFVVCEEHGDAAKAFLSASDYTQSAQHYRKAGMFDEAVNVVQTNKENIAASAAEKILDIAKIHYFTQDKIEQATQLFDDLDQAMKFMEEYEFDVARADLLERAGHFSEAAELHLTDGHVVRAITLFLQANSEVSRMRAETCLLDGLWRLLPFGVSMKFRRDQELSDSLLQDLLSLSDQFIMAPGTSEHSKDQLCMFQAIAARDVKPLRFLGERFHHKHHDNISAILCLDHLFSLPFNIQNATVFDIATILQAFLIYTKEISRLASQWDPCYDARIQQLFGFSQTSAGKFLINHGTRLKQIVLARRVLSSEEQAGLAIRANDLRYVLKSWVTTHLLERVINQNVCCQNAKAFTPCVAFGVLRDCARGQDCWRAHIPRQECTMEWFQCRIRTILQQILIYQTISASEGLRQQLKQQKFWLSILYHALFPPSSAFGSASLFDPTTIPEAERAIPVLKIWLRNLFYNLNPTPNDSSALNTTFLDNIVELIRLAIVFDHEAARQYFGRARCVTSSPASLIRNTASGEGRYVINDLLDLLQSPAAFKVSCGVLLFKHICEESHNINISVLCSLLEHICASFIIVHNLRERSSLHDIFLPLSWLYGQTFVRDVGSRDPMSTMFLLMKSVAALLDKVYVGADHLSYHGTLDRVKYQVRHIFVARICRVLCILGYNVNHSKLRSSIVDTITSLKKPERPAISRLYSGFISATNWVDLSDTLCKLEGSSIALDAWIHLREERFMTKPGPRFPISRARVIPYQQLEDIPVLLSGGTPARLEVNTAAAIHDLPHTDGPLDGGHTAAEVKLDDGADSPPDGQGPNLEVIDPAVDMDTACVKEVMPTDAEIKAARRIQRAYTQWLRRRRDAVVTATSEARQRLLAECSQASVALQLRTSYHVPFIYILPRLLVCLENTIATATVTKKRAFKRLKTAQHGDYEGAMEQVDRARNNLKKAIEWQKILGPQSPRHVKQDIHHLREEVREAVAFVTAMKSGDPSVQNLFKLLLEEPVRTVTRKGKKPELVIEDSIELAYL